MVTLIKNGAALGYGAQVRLWNPFFPSLFDSLSLLSPGLSFWFCCPVTCPSIISFVIFLYTQPGLGQGKRQQHHVSELMPL